MVTLQKLNKRNDRDFLLETDILYKEDKYEYISYLYTLDDKKSFRLMYYLFFNISKYEKKYNKNMRDWNSKNFYDYFKDIDDYSKAIREYEIIKRYINFMMEKNDAFKETIRVFDLVDMSVVYDDQNCFITHGEFLELLDNIMAQTVTQKYFEAAMLILIYHGVELRFLREYSLKDLYDGKYLYCSLGEEYVDIIKKGEKVNEYKFARRTMKLNDNSIKGLIIKATSFKYTISYYRMYNRIIERFRPSDKFDCHHLFLSGGIHFFIKECISLNTSIYDDLLHPRIDEEKAQLYMKIAEKYRLDWSMIKNRYVDVALREIEYQVNEKQQ